MGILERKRARFFNNVHCDSLGRTYCVQYFPVCQDYLVTRIPPPLENTLKNILKEGSIAKQFGNPLIYILTSM